MSFRKFVDRDNREWEVRPVARDEWTFEPTSSNPERPRTARAPGYERDPFELSKEELQQLFDSAPPPRERKKSSPFLD
jgi:hypothetical protein